jgi:prepilin-type N-terminal cleavage/methylation domain-containing protein
MLRLHASQRRNGDSRSAFTLLELLVVITVIVLLMGILLVAIGGVRQSARTAKTRQLMESVKVAVISYREQFGQLPPEVGPTGLSRYDEDEWDYDYAPSSPESGTFVSTNSDPLEATPGSDFTIAAHLLGRTISVDYGEGDREIDGVDGPGLRQPAFSGGYLWDGTTGQKPPSRGRVYEPFIDSRDRGAFVQTAAMPDYNNQKATLVVDANGNAIRYYNFKDPKPLTSNASRALSLISPGDVQNVAGNPPLTPTEVAAEPEKIPQQYRNLEFAIVAAGEDGIAGYWKQQYGGTVLSDEEAFEARRDNLVETGQ